MSLLLLSIVEFVTSQKKKEPSCANSYRPIDWIHLGFNFLDREMADICKPYSTWRLTSHKKKHNAITTYDRGRALSDLCARLTHVASTTTNPWFWENNHKQKKKKKNCDIHRNLLTYCIITENLISHNVNIIQTSLIIPHLLNLFQRKS